MDAPPASSGGSIKRICWITPRSRVRIRRNFAPGPKRFAQWLFSTDHIAIRYGIDYDGVDIRKLSPGTRDIVLLLLYLALDDSDNRPLVIDQPEENLDPKSVFDELVNLFIEAKSHRQVIMVTLNANLVINTDADQIIIAERRYCILIVDQFWGPNGLRFNCNRHTLKDMYPRSHDGASRRGTRSVPFAEKVLR
jgi:hypothetical protein